MFRIISKKVSMILMCSALVLFNIAPTFANTTVAPAVNTANLASTSVNNTLVDGSPCTQSVLKGNSAMFFINTPDVDARSILITSTVPVSSHLMATSAPFNNFVNFDSGKPRSMNYFSWHFLPGIQYVLVVTPENQSQSAVDVTVNMSKGNHVSWVKMGLNSMAEKNILSGGQNEFFGIAFETGGTYRFTISTSGKITANFNTANPIILNDSSSTFDIAVNATSNHGNYVLNLLSNNPPGSGSPYTVTIQRLY